MVTFGHVPAAQTAATAAAGGSSAGADGDPLAGDEFAGPEWRRISKQKAEALVGQALP